MPRILAFTSGPDDWRKFLADPDKHWCTGHSAKTLANCWEAADGFPPEVAAVLNSAGDPLLADLTPILAIPEFKVPLPGGKRASQNDIFVLTRSSAGPVSVMVEGRVDESFGLTIGEWLREASRGKERRLKFLLKALGLKGVPGASVRYQLMHRAASAIIEGERFRAVAAVLLIHSFSDRRSGWSDYEVFLRLFQVPASVAEVQRLPSLSSVPLFSAWVPGDLSFLTA